MQQSLVTTLVLLFVVALSPLPAAAQVALAPSHPETYTVQRGDTLWDIAGRFLRDPWQWPELWDANRDIGNPNLIFPGDVLTLYYQDGRPRVGVQGGMRTVHLSPSIRVTPLDEAIPTIPVGIIRPFLTRPYVLDRPEIENSPYIVAFPENHIVAGVGDIAYVRSIESPAVERYDLVRPGNALRDPDSGELLGYKAQFVAEALLERAGDPARVRITRMELEASAGDRVLSSVDEKAQASFFPRPGPTRLNGRIIDVLSGVSQIGQFNVVVLNVGRDEGVVPGHVFEVFNGGERVRDVGKRNEFRQDWASQGFWSQETWYSPFRVDGNLPPGEPVAGLPPIVRLTRDAPSVILPYERAGTLMIFRAFDRVSFGLIMNAERPILLLDAVRPPSV